MSEQKREIMMTDCVWNVTGEGIAPKRSTMGSAGYDLALPEDTTITAGVWTTIDFEIALKGQMGPWFLMLVPRSGMGFKYGLKMANSVGIIDSDYRDHIKARVTIDPALASSITLKKGTRILQAIVMPFGAMKDEDAPKGIRSGGIGSTGI